MWCKHCRQDVPGVAAANGRTCCIRCQSPLGGEDVLQPTAHTHGVASIAAHGVDLAGTDKPDATAARAQQAPPIDWDQWDIDAELGSLQSRRRRRIDAPLANARPIPVPRQHAPHFSTRGLAQPPAAVRVEQRRPPSRMRGAATFLAWTILSVGMMAFLCGGVLLGWSFVDGRSELWNLGMPITVVGQVALLLGLVLQLERIWQDSRYAATKLEAVDEQLHDLKNATSLLGATHGTASQSFYSHMAEGANPELLLADLKGQLDLLAVRMSQRR
jgi:hypothetical protein